MTNVVMFDAVDLSQIPANPPAVAGYVGGRFPTWSSLVKKFPNAKHVSIAVNASEDADILDVENGDAVPSDAPAWFVRQKARGIRPGFYADVSTMPAVLKALGAVGVQRDEYRVWTAHFTGVAHIEPGSDATQWTDRALGRNLDESECVPSFFVETPAQPAHVNPPHYDRFDGRNHVVGTQVLNERLLVERYDKQRKRPIWYAITLPGLKRDLGTLAGRVRTVAEQQPNPDTGRPSWGKFHRGYRYQQLAARAQGQRFV